MAQPEGGAPDAGHAPAEPPAAVAPSELERRLDVLASELEKLRLGEVAPRAEGSLYGLGPAASKVYRTSSGVSVGGYGEALYRNFVDPAKNDSFDFLRAVLYVGYKFSDKFVLNTEIEVEHAREIWVEFAYVDYLWRPEVAFRGGLLLVPMGFINELHEPTMYLGALRPETEQRILPSTWRENGLGVFGTVGPVSYRAYLLNGLKGSGFTAAGLRGGRQKGAEAIADDLAAVARVDYQGVNGLLVGGSLYYGGSGQQLATEVPTLVYEAHLDYKWRGLELRGLIAGARLQNVGALNTELKLVDRASIGNSMQGWYVQAGYDVMTLISGSKQAVVPFFRWESLNTQQTVPRGFSSSAANSNLLLTAGVNYHPVDQVVLKAEFQSRRSAGGIPQNQVNALLGYIF